jgi:hypothetical protein
MVSTPGNADNWFDAESPIRFLALLYFLDESALDMGVERDDEAAEMMPAAIARSRAVRVVAVAATVGLAAALGYALLAPLAAPWVAKLAFDGLVTDGDEWTMRAEHIRFEPFALALDLEQAQLATLDGDIAAAARSVRMDFSYASLFEMRPVLDAVQIRGGELRDAPRAAAAIWSSFGAFALDTRIAVVEADVVLGATQRDRAVPTVEVHGMELELGAGRGALVIEARDALGGGSRLEVELTAVPSNTGARLNGVAALARSEATVDGWTIAAPSAALSLDAALSLRTVTASLALLAGSIATTDSGTVGARLELTDGTATTVWRGETGNHEASARGALAGGGQLALALARAPSGGWLLETSFTAVPAASLASYVADALGAAPTSGTLELSIALREPPAAGMAHITGRSLRVAADAPAAAAAIALLEEPDGAITLEIPLAPGGRAAEQIAAEIAARVAALAAAPFDALASLVDRSAEELATIEFVPGTAEPTLPSQEALAELATALRLRPLVGVRLDADQTTALDRAALARAQVALHITLATSRAEPVNRDAAIDFASPRTQDVLDEFARERLDSAALASLAAAFALDDEQPTAEAQRADYYRAVFEALAAREPIADTALRRLAGFRVRVIAGRLAELGVASSRVAGERDAETPLDDSVLVVLPLTLTPATIADSRLP